MVLPPRHLLQAGSKASLRCLKTCCVRNVKQSATPCSSSGMVNSVSRRLDCGLDGACLKARAVPAERYSYLADLRDQSAGVVHDEYTLLPGARSTTWPERARAGSDPSGPDPLSNWLRCSSHGFCHQITSLPHACAMPIPELVYVQRPDR
jgi:hypothetical protein